MREISEYTAGKRFAQGVLCGFAVFLAVIIVVPSVPDPGLDAKVSEPLPGQDQVDVFGFAYAVKGKYVKLEVVQPLIAGPDLDGLDRKALEEMAGKGFGSSYASSSFEDLIIDADNSPRGNSRRTKADKNESGGWLVSRIRDDEGDTSASGETDFRDTESYLDRSGSRLIDESGGVRSDVLYGDRDPGTR